MPEQEIISKHREHPGRYQVLSDGSRVWVNGPNGESVARLASAYGHGPALIDVHNSYAVQQQTGEECLDCRHDLQGAEAWRYFVQSIQRNYGLMIGEVHRPAWARDR